MVRCPFCSADDDKVVDSRPADDAASVRRRRECLACGKRYTTYERVEELPLVVVKRSGVKEPFDAEKLRGGIERAVAGKWAGHHIGKVDFVRPNRSMSQIGG